MKKRDREKEKKENSDRRWVRIVIETDMDEEKMVLKYINPIKEGF